MTQQSEMRIHLMHKVGKIGIFNGKFLMEINWKYWPAENISQTQTFHGVLN